MTIWIPAKSVLVVADRSGDARVPELQHSPLSLLGTHKLRGFERPRKNVVPTPDMRHRFRLRLYLFDMLKLGQVCAGPQRTKTQTLQLFVELIELISGSDEVGSCERHDDLRYRLTRCWIGSVTLASDATGRLLDGCRANPMAEIHNDALGTLEFDLVMSCSAKVHSGHFLTARSHKPLARGVLVFHHEAKMVDAAIRRYPSPRGMAAGRIVMFIVPSDRSMAPLVRTLNDLHLEPAHEELRHRLHVIRR